MDTETLLGRTRTSTPERMMFNKKLAVVVT
jgi:hypothetical protein